MLVVDGADIRTSTDFHKLFAGHPKVPTFYGKNLSAFRDALAGLIERPFEIIWFNAEISAANMGPDFDKLVQIMKNVEAEDAARPSSSERFRLSIIVGPLNIFKSQ